MKNYRIPTMIGGLLVTASLALAQVASPVPPAPPAVPARATPVPASAARGLEAAQDALDQAARIDVDVDVRTRDAIQLEMDKLRQMDVMQLSAQDWSDAQGKVAAKVADAQGKAAAKVAEAQGRIAAKVAEAQGRVAAADVLAGKLQLDALSKSLALQATVGRLTRIGDDGLYQSGLNHIDNHQYDLALSEFNRVATGAGAHAEGALYWEAYVANKLGRSSAAQAAIDALRKTYPGSRWLDDAKALELEVQQSKGPVSPESETDEDIKILALNGLMQSDPEKALPQVENLLKGSHSPRLKKQALIVIGQSNLPKAQQDLEEIARGGNPDLQARAIQYLAQKRNDNTDRILSEIYTSTSDSAVKQAVLATFTVARDRDRLVQIVKTEKDEKVRTAAIGKLGDVEGQPELWQIYQSENSADGKVIVLNAMRRNGNLDKLAEAARTDKDPKVRQTAIRVIATQLAGTPSAALVALYGSEQDEKVKQTIIEELSRPRDCKPLVDVAKAEKDVHFKLRIVERLSGMTKSCPAATEYLTELLSK
jgi:TolA-binding protein